MSDSREAFEAWAIGADAIFDKTHKDYDPIGEYIAWKAWLARDAEIAALKARVEELEQEVALKFDWVRYEGEQR
jgi:hypothetical protein